MPQNIFVSNDIFDLGDVTERRAAIAPLGVMIGNRQGLGLLATVGAELRQVRPINRPIMGGARQRLMWLPYSPGAANYVAPGAHPVLSGPFTGCYMIAYQQAGLDYVCHVATPDAKASWNRFAHSQGVTILRGFQPHAHTRMPPFTTTGRNGDLPGAFFIFGLMANNEMYSLYTYKQQADGIPMNTQFRIAEIAGPIPTLPIASLKNLP